MTLGELFNKRIDELETKIYKTEFDISNYFLPEEEIVKNVIRSENPSMSKHDINLMVHGPDYKPPTETVEKPSTEKVIQKNNYTFNVSGAGDSWNASILYNGKIIGTKSYTVNYSTSVNGIEYTGQEAVKKVLEYESKTFGFVFSGQFYPKVEEVVEKIIPSLPIPKSDDNTSNKLNALSDYSPYPLQKDSRYYKEAKKQKDEIKKAAALFMLSKKELTNQLVSSLTLLGTSIPGIAMMVSAPPWNIPAALSLASLVMDSLNDLISKSVKAIQNLSPLKKLSLVLSEDKMRLIISILNPVVSVLIAILDPIEKIKSFIQKLIDRIKALFKSNSCRKQIRRIKKQISKKNKELSKLKGEQVIANSKKDTSTANSLQDDIDDIEDEISDLKQQLSEIENRCGKKVSIEQDLEQLNTLVDQVSSESDTWIETLSYETVYDISLPDGTNLVGITEEQLEKLKGEYNIVFN